jgi:hydroxymethylglutaryl-CoA lyase
MGNGNVIREIVYLQEVGPRDGLQNESRALPPEDRVQLIDLLSEAGLKRIQIGSFVNPRRVPQMLGTHLVWAKIRKSPFTRYSVLILNEKGMEQAISHCVSHVEVFVSASQTHSIKNSGATIEQAKAAVARIVKLALESEIGISVGVMCAFGCYYEGPVSLQMVVETAAEFDSYKPTEIVLADSPGLADPKSIKRTLAAVSELVSMDRVSIHLHNTRGLGLANMKAALEMGVRRFDSSVGGLGGCPFIPGAAGNISTEASVMALESLGFDTGVDLGKVFLARNVLEKMLARKVDAGLTV